MRKTCVGEGDLRDFLLGRVSDEEAESVARHLESCPTCEDAARHLDGTADALVGSLRHALRAPPLPAPSAGPAGFELLDEVGRGGMGVVYRARDLALDREVAVKVLQDHFLPDGPAAQRFLGEARITGQLQHPGVPAVHHVGRLADRRPFLVMKLIKGRTLEEILKARPDPAAEWGRLLAVFEAVCQAVAYAHSKGVIHRDLKPANIMVGSFGEVQVMDWGLAKLLGDRPASAGPEAGATIASSEIRSPPDTDEMETQAGSVLGTPGFMPPEQAIGAIDRIDTRSDVFGLGAILAVILTDQPPFLGPDSESTRQLSVTGQLGECFARLDSSGADPELIALAKRCLAAEKADRPPDAGTLAEAVAQLRQAAEERARKGELDRVRAEGERAKAELRALEQRKRRRVQLALAGALGLLLLGGGAFAWWQDRQANDRRTEAEKRERDMAERQARNRDALGDSLGRCEDALRAGDPETAALALADVEKRLPEGGGEGLMPRVERCRADVDLLTEIDRIHNLRVTPVDGKDPDMAASISLWEKAFARIGILPGSTSAAEAGRRIRQFLAADALLLTLDIWLADAPTRALADILHSADPDRFRDAVRTAILAKDGDRVRELAGQEEMLHQPIRFAATLGVSPYVAVQRRRAVLEKHLLERPDDFRILGALGFTYPMDQREGAEERARWYQAAVATRPRNTAAWTHLGFALRDMGNADGAVAAFQEAVRLDPKLPHALNGLAWLLAVGPDGLRDGKRAVELATRACERTAWKNGRVIDTLAAAYAEVGDFDKAVEYQKKALPLPELGTEVGPEARRRLELYSQKKPYRDPAFMPRDLAPPPREVKGP
jgi:serine/threonine protein kinase